MPAFMPITHTLLEVETEPGIQIYNLTARIQEFVQSTAIAQGQVLVFSRHTTTALAINEDEPRLYEDLRVYLQKLAPEKEMAIGDKLHRYWHNDLHLRPNIPADEPENAHSHLMAVTLSTSEVIPIINGQLALGTYQSILLFELDGPRKRSVLLQVSGE
jgi:secondary thiamine-phosphate synthase enzyme